MILGFIPMLTIGKIVIDKNKKSFSFYGGSRKFFLTPKTAYFSEISCVAVERVSMRLEIVVKMHDKSSIKIDWSNDIEDIKEMAVKISEFVGCVVYFDP